MNYINNVPEEVYLINNETNKTMRQKSIKNKDKKKVFMDVHVFLMREDITIQSVSIFYDTISEEWKSNIPYYD